MMNILKGVLTACLAVFIFLLLGADGVKDVDTETIRTALLPAPGIENLTEGNDHDLKRFFGIEAGDTKGYVYYRSPSIMTVDEILIVRAENEAAAKAMETQCEERLSVLRTNFEGYGTDQMAVIDQAILKTRGPYLFYAASLHASDWERIFTDEVKS
jgi:hypothetical protein